LNRQVYDPQVGQRRFYRQMKVIAHEAIGVRLPAGLLAGFAEGLQEMMASSSAKIASRSAFAKG